MEVLERRFAAIGARLSLPERPWHGSPRIDVEVDRRGERFDVRFTGRGDREVELEVVDARPRDRHLLLLVRNGDEKSKFLCGHDERHWFVAAVPESARGVTGVAAAKAALQPVDVRVRVARVRPKDPFRRRNRAYVRQGEWFFVPAPELQVDDALVLCDEPLTRGRGTAHVLQYAYRTSRSVVHLDDRLRRRGAPLVRVSELYARGAVRHPDHATIHLPGWHRVLMNTEQGARAMRHVAFLD